MVTVKKLTVEFPGVRALNNIEFSIEEGSITALVGPNGSGKTTLLECIAGIRVPYKGQVYINGIDVLKQPREAHQLIGFLPDRFGLHDQLTVWECFDYFASAYNIPPDNKDKRIGDVAELIGLTNSLYVKTGTLSRGMRQRVAIGQTLLHKPKVLLLDEPASGLDPESRFALSELFKRLQREGMTIFVSSHILAELEQYASKLMILKEGQTLSPNSTAQETERLVVKTLDSSESYKTILELNPMVQEVFTADWKTFEVIYKGKNSDKPDFLKFLLDNGMKVCSFSTQTKSMERTYMDNISEL